MVRGAKDERRGFHIVPKLHPEFCRCKVPVSGEFHQVACWFHAAARSGGLLGRESRFFSLGAVDQQTA
jgi:hypothetical protein